MPYTHHSDRLITPIGTSRRRNITPQEHHADRHIAPIGTSRRKANKSPAKAGRF